MVGVSNAMSQQLSFCLWRWHPIWVLACVPTITFMIQSLLLAWECRGGWPKSILVQDPEETSASRLWISSAPTAAVILASNHWKKDLYLGVSLLSNSTF